MSQQTWELRQQVEWMGMDAIVRVFNPRFEKQFSAFPILYTVEFVMCPEQDFGRQANS
jgi:hypothetical protein